MLDYGNIFPTCQVRVVRFYVSLFSSSSSRLARRVRVGPQPRSCVFSVACRTSTASSCVQCGVSDLNCELVSSVWRAGP